MKKAQVYVHDLHIFVTVQLLENTPDVLPHGKLCKEHGCTHERPSGREPRLTKNTGSKPFAKLRTSCHGQFQDIEFHLICILDIASAGSIYFLDPANTRSHKGVTENCGEEVAGNCSKGIPEWPEDFAQNLEDTEVPATAHIAHAQIRNVPQKWHQGSTVFTLTSQKTEANQNYKGSLKKANWKNSSSGREIW